MENNAPASEIHVNSESLQKLIILMKTLCNKIEWDKKSRIVVTYNPAEKTTLIQVYKEQ